MCPSPPPPANCPVLTATAQRGGNCTGILLILFRYVPVCSGMEKWGLALGLEPASPLLQSRV